MSEISVDILGLVSICLSFSEDVRSNASTFGAAERPEAITVVGNALSGGTAGV